ncbi:MAG: hypothetical protein R6X22_11830 [Gemmatimonadota bacterium]
MERKLAEARSAALRVPSVIVPAEPDYLLNSLHPDLTQAERGTGGASAGPALVGRGDE